jgi:POT family proton-dependent oligopeptide transporter
MYTREEIHNFEGKYPKQLLHLAGSEMWERFCFYGMRGMLTVFMVTQLGLGDKEANLQYGAIQAFVYAFTFIGGRVRRQDPRLPEARWSGALPTDDRRWQLVIAASRPRDVLLHRHTASSSSARASSSRTSPTMVGQLYSEGDSRRNAGLQPVLLSVSTWVRCWVARS